MIIKKEEFGTLSTGEKVTSLVLENDSGLSISAIDYGATLTSVKSPDRSGDAGEVTLGFDTIEGYEGDHPYFGATVGRYANRISGGSFTLSGKTYPLFCNEPGVHLHGGESGFNRKMWSAEVEAEANKGIIKFHRVSPDGEENYPGSLDVTVSFILTEANELFFDYTATTDRPTPINLTNHTYWNLAGPGGFVLDHLLTLNGNRYLVVNDELVPTGETASVEGTSLDFRAEKRIGEGIDETGGYDHCYTLPGKGEGFAPAATVKDPSTGRCMSIETDQPAIQFYTSNMLEETTGREGVIFKKYGALCLETGTYVDSINNPSFPDSVLVPGGVYRHTTKHTFWSE
jgi:aldose 1-epimerase